MEWFYSETSDEPSVFEGDSHGSASAKARPPDVFSSRAAVEIDPRSECETEPEYFGASDEPEEILAPEEAFIKFFNQSTSARPGQDFSTALYAEAATNQVPKIAPRRNPAAESRDERIARLAAELNSIEKETVAEAVGSENSIADFSELRAQLKTIEEAATIPPPLLVRHKNNAKEIVGEENARASAGLTIQIISPDVTTVSVLEQRVSALERSVGLSHQSDFCYGRPLTEMMREIHDRLDFATDTTLAGRLKADAREIAEVLQKQVGSEEGSKFVKSATVLDKMEKWERLADTVPVVVERLRCFKRLQEEAGNFVASLAALGKQVDSLAKRSEVNGSLIANVTKNLETNCATVQANLDILERRLDGQLEKEG